MFALMNARTNSIVADRVEVAVTRRARRRGLLGRSGLQPSSALVLAPCAAVHTLFMRFSIDVLFVDREGRVVRVVPRLAPWRAAASLAAHATIELPEGSLASGDVSIGDQLFLRANGHGARLPLRASDLREAVC